MSKCTIKEKGYSLIEIIITIAIMAIITQVIYSVFFVGNHSFVTSKDIGFAQQEVRNASVALSNKLKSAKQISNIEFVADSPVKEINIEYKIIDSKPACYINIENQTFGPFVYEEFYISHSNKSFFIELIDLNFSRIGGPINIYFENWNRFIYTDDFKDEFGNPINLTTLYYTEYE